MWPPFGECALTAIHHLLPRVGGEQQVMNLWLRSMPIARRFFSAGATQHAAFARCLRLLVTAPQPHATRVRGLWSWWGWRVAGGQHLIQTVFGGATAVTAGSLTAEARCRRMLVAHVDGIMTTMRGKVAQVHVPAIDSTIAPRPATTCAPTCCTFCVRS